MNDLDLLLEYRTRRSEESFEALVRRHVNMVYGATLRHLQDAQLAEDATQTVFVLLAQKAQSLSSRVILGGWLYRTACFVALRMRRDQRRREDNERKAAAMTEEISDEQLWQEISPVLDSSLAELGQTDRDALVLRFLEQRSFREVAENLGTNEDAAKKRVSRAIEKLRGRFAARGIATGTAALAAVLGVRLSTAAPEPLVNDCVRAAASGAAPAIEFAEPGIRWAPLKWAAVLLVSFGVLFFGSRIVRSKLTPPERAPSASRTSTSQTTAVIAAQPIQSAKSATEPFMKLHVVAAETGTAIPDAEVISIFYGSGYERDVQKTDAEGALALQRRGGGKFHGFAIFTGAPGRVPLSVVWKEHEELSIPSEYTVRLKEGSRLLGRVIDETGAPVAGATLHFNGEGMEFLSRESVSYSPSCARPVSDRAGYFEANFISPKAKWLAGRVEHPDFAPTTFSTNLHPGTVESLLLVAKKGGVVEGTLKTESGDPVANAPVKLQDLSGWRDSRSTNSDEHGRFSFGRIADGKFRIAITPDDYKRADAMFDLGPAGTNIQIVLKPVENLGEAILRGRLVDGEGNGLSYGEVILFMTGPDSPRWRADVRPDGRFQWRHAPEGILKLIAAAGEEERKIVELPSDGVEHEIQFPAKPKLTLSGTVRDAKSGQAVTARLVFTPFPAMFGSAQQEFLGESYAGIFAFRLNQEKFAPVRKSWQPQPMPGTKEVANLMLSADGYRKKSVDLPVQTNDISMTIELEPGGDLAGTVLLANGQPADGAQVGFRTDSGGSWIEAPGKFGEQHHPSQISTLTGADGRFQIEPVFDAKRVVVVHDQGWACVPLTFENQTITLQPWGSVQGRAFAGSRPLSRVTVTIGSGWTEKVGYGFSTETDDTGKFEFPKVPAGTAQAELQYRSGNIGVSSHPTRFTVKAGERTNVQIGGSGVRVIGRIVPQPSRTDIDWTKSAQHLQPKSVTSEIRGLNPPGSYGFFTNPDGTFVVEDVASGDYRLVINLVSSQPRVDKIGNVLDNEIGMTSKEISIGDENIDLGEITVSTRADN